MKIGLSTHLLVYETLCPLWIKKIKEYGFSFIEIWGMRPHFDYKNSKTVSELWSFLEKEGMQALTFHAPFYLHVNDAKEKKWLSISSQDEEERKKILGEIKEVMDIMGDFGGEVLVLHCGLETNREGDSPPKNLNRSIEALLEYASKRNIRLALENTPNKYSTTEKILDIVKQFPSDTVGVCLDIGHANVLEDPVEAVQIVSGHLFSIHASDNDGSGDAHLSPLKGNIRWEKIKKALSDASFNGPFMLELRNYGEYDEVLSDARDFVRKVFPSHS
jgi:sugar phosphate isomerase/epimerase